MWNYILTVLCIDFLIMNSVIQSQVSLRNKYTDRHICGGSVLTPCWILTAAHCINFGLKFYVRTIVVVAGETYLKPIKDSHQWSNVSLGITHPNYNEDTFQHDIALLVLKRKLVLDPYVHPISVMRDPPIPDTMCQVSGWGYTKENGVGSNRLLFVGVPIISNDECRKLQHGLTQSVICAGYLEGGKDSCQGDSGGGMICNELLTGIVSSGEGCARPKCPGLYTDITDHVQWIEQYVNLTEKHVIRATPHRGASSKLQFGLFRVCLCVNLFINSYLIDCLL